MSTEELLTIKILECDQLKKKIKELEINNSELSLQVHLLRNINHSNSDVRVKPVVNSSLYIGIA